MADLEVNPDECLLKHIFTTNQPKAISIFLQDWDKCVFKAEFRKDPQTDYTTCVVRLESVDEEFRNFTMIAAIQQIAATVIPDLVPKTVQGDLLEDVWQLLSADEQSNVVVELAEALQKLHSVRISDTGTQEILRKMIREDGEEIQPFLETAGKLKRPFCTMESVGDSQDVSIQSSFEDMGLVVINNSEIGKWQGESVLCHNDLTPRNLIIQSHASVDGKLNYKLAGIVDWELAGFFPPSYELSMQDTYFSADRHISFYLLLKEHMKNMVPRPSSQIALVQAMTLIYESQQRLLFNGNNIPAQIRMRVMENSKLTRDNDPYAGWTRSSQDGPLSEYSSAAFEKLVDDLVEEMVARRESKPK
ncbi:hypothetical protein VE03_04633 [Pseudogymnoascus sp. 23342-1-I1]|nr:hypothetical protein VE03_04633 [Pseudogymnoascus sp. 23342-1-I1]